MQFTIKDTQLPKFVEVPGMVDRVDIESKDIKEIHDEFAHMRHGVLIRRSLEWEEYFRWEVEDLTAAVYYNAAHNQYLPPTFLLHQTYSLYFFWYVSAFQDEILFHKVALHYFVLKYQVFYGALLYLTPVLY